MTDEQQVVPEALVDEEPVLELEDEEPVEDDFENENENENENEGDEVPEGVDPAAFWRERFKHTQRKLGEQGGELGELRKLRDQAPPPAPDPAAQRAAQQQQAIHALALEKYEELVQDGWVADSAEDHRTWGEALKRAAREHERLQRYAGQMAQEQLAPFAGLVLESAGGQLIARDVQAAMPAVSGVSAQEVAQALGTNVAADQWLALPPAARAGLVELTAKSMAYERLAAAHRGRVPSPENPRVAAPAGSGTPPDPRLAREAARLRGINPDITQQQAEDRVRGFYSKTA